MNKHIKQGSSNSTVSKATHKGGEKASNIQIVNNSKFAKKSLLKQGGSINLKKSNLNTRAHPSGANNTPTNKLPGD